MGHTNTPETEEEVLTHGMVVQAVGVENSVCNTV